MEDLKGFLEAQGLTISTVPDKGRGLFTTRDFSPGQVIISQQPYVSTPSQSSAASVCHRCYRTDNLKQCSKCKYAWYCGSECQELDWKLHKHECQAFSTLDRNARICLRPFICMVARLFIRRKLENEKVLAATVTENYNLVQEMVSHEDAEQLRLYEKMAGFVNWILDRYEINEAEIAKYVSKLLCNAHQICNSELEPVGSGLYPAIAFINHSCAPNSILVFDGSLAVVRAVQHIPQGAEVLISYIYTEGSTKTRREALERNYNFTCLCSRCANMDAYIQEEETFDGFRCKNDGCNGILLCYSDEAGKCRQCGQMRKEKSFRKMLKKMKNTLHKARLAASSGPHKEQLYLPMAPLENFDTFLDREDALLKFRKIEKLMNKVCHPFSVHLMQVRDGIALNLEGMGDLRGALAYYRLTLPVRERIYPGVHPVLGVQYSRCGLLELVAGDKENAVKLLTKAVDILQVTHGEDAPLVKETLMNLEIARAGSS